MEKKKEFLKIILLLKIKIQNYKILEIQSICLFYLISTTIQCFWTYLKCPPYPKKDYFDTLVMYTQLFYKKKTYI